jgi:anaphase-promoting complex subunit 3
LTNPLSYSNRHIILCIGSRLEGIQGPMQAEASSSTSSEKCLPARFGQLIWSCLDAGLHRSAVFYAERYYAMYPESHDTRHLYATALLQSGQPHTAHHFVTLSSSVNCSGCLEIKAKCCTALGRHKQARDALEECLKDALYTPTRTSPSLYACCMF